MAISFSVKVARLTCYCHHFSDLMASLSLIISEFIRWDFIRSARKKQTNSHDEIKKVVGVQAVGAIFYLIIFF